MEAEREKKEILLRGAAFGGDERLLEEMVKAGVNVESTDRETGMTALMIGSWAGNERIVRKLLEAGARIDAVAEGRNGMMMTALIAASMRGHSEIVKAFLHHLRDHRQKDSEEEEKAKALIAASRNGHVKVVRELIGARSPMEVSEKGGKRTAALETASRNGHEEVVEALIESGADVEAISVVRTGESESNWSTALLAASERGHARIVGALLRAGARRDRGDRANWTPCMVASHEGHAKVVETLARAGADIDAPNDGGWTPLMVASLKGRESVVDILLAAGTRVNAKNSKTGETALSVAVAAGNTEIVKKLIAAGSDVESRVIAFGGGREKTVLEIAVEKGNDEMIGIIEGAIREEKKKKEEEEEEEEKEAIEGQGPTTVEAIIEVWAKKAREERESAEAEKKREEEEAEKNERESRMMVEEIVKRMKEIEEIGRMMEETRERARERRRKAGEAGERARRAGEEEKKRVRKEEEMMRRAEEARRERERLEGIAKTKDIGNLRTEEDVEGFMREAGVGSHAKRMKAKGIVGRALEQVGEEEMKRVIGMSQIKDRARFIQAIEMMKTIGRIRMPSTRRVRDRERREALSVAGWTAEEATEWIKSKGIVSKRVVEAISKSHAVTGEVLLHLHQMEVTEESEIFGGTRVNQSDIQTLKEVSSKHHESFISSAIIEFSQPQQTQRP